MNRGRGGSLAGNPLLIGAITTLIVVVAVFLSYNANNGLPFVPTYDIKVALPEASGLQKSNQVKIAGTRVGVIDSIKAHQDPRTGRISAIASLKLEKNIEPLPADTRAIVQSVSAIGLKYLELEKGTAQGQLKPGATIPVAQTREPVDIDQLFNMFDQPTRTALKIDTNQFGNGVAGRGLGLNNTIHELRPLVNNAIPALRNLAAPQTGLRELWIALERAANQTAPVADTQGALWVDLDTFFAAWAGASRSVEEATEGGPASLEQAIHSLPFQAPFTRKATLFMHLLRPSAAALVTVAPPLGHAFKEGAVNLREATTLNNRLAESSQALASFGQNPVVKLGLEDFTETLLIGEPLLAGIAPEQSICNYWTLAFRNVASLESGSVGVGTLARAQLKLAPTGPNNEGYPSSAIANGPSTEHPFHSTAVIDNNHVHANPYPNVAGPGQPQLCEAGNETWLPGKAVTTNLPANAVSTNRELTTRETDLFGEPYPAATLKALGVTKAKAPAEEPAEGVTKKAVKKKGKKK
jgi:phospholipid/cholesterol/gamma-HCH transport system substrate-binding protein